MESSRQKIQRLRQRLDAHRPLPPELVANLDEWYRVELTYTSNAIEGNTLTRRETALVVEKGITVAGKSLREHLEATNHAEAFDYVLGLLHTPRQQLTADDVLKIHRLVLHSIDDANAGRFRSVPVRISGSPVVLPGYQKVPDLMAEFFTWLRTTSDDALSVAVEAHYRFVSIHPFVDGNGRTGRLLMNLVLMQAGYPAAVIRPEDRAVYLAVLEKGQTSGDTNDYRRFMFDVIAQSLDAYVRAVEGEPVERPAAHAPHRLLSRQQLVDLSGIRASTIKHYSDVGLLPFHQEGAGLARRYDEQEAITRLKKITDLQADGLELDEIRHRLDGEQDMRSDYRQAA